MLSAVLALLLVVAVIAAAVAFAQNRVITSRRDEAVGAQMANLAVSIRRSDPVTARRLALAGSVLAPDDVITASALQTVYSQVERSIYRPEKVTSVYRHDGDPEGWHYDVDRTGRTVVYAKNNEVLIVDVDNRAVRRGFTVPGGPIQQVSLSADGTSVAMTRPERCTPPVSGCRDRAGFRCHAERDCLSFPPAQRDRPLSLHAVLVEIYRLGHRDRRACS